MSKPLLATPCPAPTSAIPQHRLSIISAASHPSNDTTTNIDFTRALGPSLKTSKPRRRSSLLNGNATRRAPVTIFEDVLEDEELLPPQKQQVPKGETLFCKPARKIGVWSSTAAAAAGMTRAGRPQPQQQEQQQSKAEHGTSGPAPQRIGLRELGQGRTRPTTVKTDHAGAIGMQKRTSSNVLKKEPRRRTIYIPEDTTVLTIHPGASNTVGLDDTFQLLDLNVPPPPEGQDNVSHDVSDNFTLQKPVRRPRKSLMAAPRRGPLLTHDVDLKQNTESWDVCGANTGKENIPPAGFAKFKVSVPTSPEARPLTQGSYRAPVQQTTASRKQQDIGLPTNVRTQSSISTAYQTKQGGGQSNAIRRGGPVNTAITGPARYCLSTTVSARHIGQTEQRDSVGHQMQESRRPHPQRSSIVHYPEVPKSCVKPKQDLRTTIATKRVEMHQAKSQQYPVLVESLPYASMYETEWLDQQEVALKEILNAIFDAASSSDKKPLTHEKLRKGMIDLYHQDEVALLHQRIQASIKDGFLAKPQSLSRLELSLDLGLTKQFMSLWIESYTEEALHAAVEVVTGHAVESHSGAPGTTLDPKAGRRALIGFIQTFFIFVGDVKCLKGTSPLRADAAKARWEKTMERSLMLVWLLDEAKVTGLIRGTLFNEISPIKSSTEILRALSKILCPTIGDITRVLLNLGYERKHVQDPLDEVSYQVKNLAVDLRDGILLARLAEVLLWPRPGPSEVTIDDIATITIVLPENRALQSDLYTSELLQNTRMLSQHLRIPCLSRSLKEYNVQIALSALEGQGLHGANAVAGVTAQDIVSGHRERTLSLLWSLVCIQGLDYLVDWKQLADDTHCTVRDLVGCRVTNGSVAMLPPRTLEERQSLLFSWADAHLRQAGMGELDNFNTAFTNGAPYLALVEGFEKYILESFTKRPEGRSVCTVVDIEVQLQRIGCSRAFIDQVRLSIGMIPHRNTTISNLAFLASRLLPLRKKHFAAITIQRAYRKHRLPTVITQRITLMRLAREAVVFVNFERRMLADEERMIWAATVIQRAYRRHFARDVYEIQQNFAKFINIARGWIVRRAISRSVGRNNQVRVMGRR